MKSFVISLFVLLMLSPCVASCDTEEPNTPEIPGEPGNDNNDNHTPMSNQLKITIGGISFTVTLESNATTSVFKRKLPMTLNMSELNGNEKLYYLNANLPTATSRPGTIYTGDLMLYGSNCLVLFYDTFSSSYSYTRLGRVDNPSGLAVALGSGEAMVKFELVNN